MDKPSLVFCVMSLVVSFAVSAIAFPFAARPNSAIEAERMSVDPETLGSIDLGDFGQVSVSELMHYYVANPPPAASEASPAKSHRFQGC